MRRLILVLLVVLLIGGGILLSRALQAQSAADSTGEQVLDTTTAALGSLRLTVSATGGVTPMRQVPLLFEASGLVHDVFVSVGDHVSAGDVLARLDTTDLEAALSDAQVTLEIQQIAYDALTSPPRAADLAAAQAAVNAAQAALAAASSSTNPNAAQIAALQSELARNQLWQAQLQRDIAANATGFSPDISGLIPDKLDVPQDVIDRINAGLAGVIPSFSLGSGVPESTLDQAQYGVAIADANAASAANRTADAGGIASANAALVQAQQQLNRLRNGPSDFDLQAAQINLGLAQLAVDQAQAALDRATLAAPFAGVIASSALVVGEFPPTSAPALLLVDDAALYVDLAVDETDVVKLSLGQPVELSFDALPDAAISGQVLRIGAQPTIVGQLVTYPVRVSLDPTDEPVRIGMSATATIVVDQVDEVLVVPNKFIRIDRTTQQAYVTIPAENGGYSEIPVQLGLRSELASQISAGLSAGQTLVLLPGSSFNPFGS